ncbi:hypothetical protein LCGC14_2523190 [marine sediment metagenome]|uniref:Alpha/beta hydrolase n=1 Tax=marine sediment metagenome TaxID=412755 RepID=A0A0F9D7G2_9ZZZZ
MPYTDHFLTLDNRRVGYVDEGPRDAPCVVLLHGGAFDHAELSWRLAVPVLRERFRVVAPLVAARGGDALSRRLSGS